MKVIICEPRIKPYVKDIDGDLKSLQEEVRGYIEVVYPFEDEVAIIVNEEGKLIGLPFNRILCDEYGNEIDIIVGNMIVVGLNEEDFCSLTDEQIEKYKEFFE